MSGLPVEAHSVKKNSHIMLKGHPCRIVDVVHSKTGKHGHAKCNITGLSVLTSKRYNDVFFGHIVLAAFIPQINEYELLDFDKEESTFSAMGVDGEMQTVGFIKTYDAVGEEFMGKLTAQDANEEIIYTFRTITAPVGEMEELKTYILDYTIMDE